MCSCVSPLTVCFRTELAFAVCGLELMYIFIDCVFISHFVKLIVLFPHFLNCDVILTPCVNAFSACY